MQCLLLHRLRIVFLVSIGGVLACDGRLLTDATFRFILLLQIVQQPMDSSQRHGVIG